MRRSLEFDGFIGDSNYDNDDDYDLSGELISIEETYKEMALYRKSGASNDALTNSLRNEALTTSLLNSDSHQKRNVRINDSHNEIQVSSRTPSAIDHLANSQDTSDKMKRSMTVILEEDMEDSNLNFT